MSSESDNEQQDAVVSVQEEDIEKDSKDEGGNDYSAVALHLKRLFLLSPLECANKHVERFVASPFCLG